MLQRLDVLAPRQRLGPQVHLVRVRVRVRVKLRFRVRVRVRLRVAWATGAPARP